MKQQERREAILEAATMVFAQKGFPGATVKDVAKAASVSEALLYKHFPSKESLHASIGIQRLEDSASFPLFTKMLDMPPSTARLICSIQFIFTYYAAARADVLPRLMAQSLLGDGKFVRTFLNRIKSSFFDFLMESLKAAQKVGDLEDNIKIDELQIWFTHHLAVSFKLMELPKKSAVSYGKSRKVVMDQLIRFALRGIGLKTKAIQKYYETKIME